MMILFYILLFLLIISSLRYVKTGHNQDYLSFDTTNAVKGIFILLVFISHVVPYISSTDLDFGNFFMMIHNRVGQWIVAMFLFYSGYGIMESIKKQGKSYVSSIPQKRLLTVLLNFDVAVLVYICIDCILSGGVNLNPLICLLSFVGWESMGNSNWYIFVIMLAYLITYISFVPFNKKTNNYILSSIITNILLFVFMILLSYFKGSWWYDTILCFGAGIIFSNYKEQIENLLKSHYKFILIVVVLLLLVLSNIPLHLKGLRYNCFSILYCVLIVLVTLKFRFDSRTLVWLGKNLFPLYIYQRIPMIILASVDNGMFVATYPVIYTSICLLVTLLIAYFYKFGPLSYNYGRIERKNNLRYKVECNWAFLNPRH